MSAHDPQILPTSNPPDPAVPARALPHGLQGALQDRRDRGLYRTRPVVEGPCGTLLRTDARDYLAFCSNDYLGLANDPRVRAAFVRGMAHYGVGAGASHLVTGHTRAHHTLEEALADFVGAERALLFSTGYMANLGLVQALAARDTTVIEDRLNHASLIDAARLAGARLVRYRHADMDALARHLAAARGAALVLSDGVFSMDGDLAPLPALLALARAHAVRGGVVRVIVDDAHGLGVLGKRGGGSFEQHALGLVPPAILMGTLGKAFGVFGAFVAGEDALIEHLIQQARTYIYTTALPPAVAEAALESLGILVKEGWRRERLTALVARFCAGARQLGYELPGQGETPIVPVILGSAARAMAASAHLRERGLWVTAIRPPTVPGGSARLRITFSAMHTEAEVDRLLDALASLPKDVSDTP